MTDVREICNLSDEDLKVRRAELLRGLGSRVRERRDLSDGVALSFDATSEIREELDAFVAFERECCSTLDFSVSEVSGALQLEIRGVPPGSDLFQGVGPDAGSLAGASSRWRRIFSSIGLGSLGALAVCCLLPVGLMAALGTAAAAPFANLDNPGVISATALGFAAGIWLWQRRRENARLAAASSEGCGC